jgi:ATP adenylyltransferase
VNKSVASLREILNPEGFNIGVNIGKAAGGGEEHIHIHVVPRWDGDTNFMPVLAEVKVIPEHLEATYKRLLLSFKEI